MTLALSGSKPQAASSLSSFFETSWELSKKTLNFVQNVIVIKQVVGIVFVPSSIYKVVETSLSFSDLNKDKKIDAGLNVATEMKEIIRTSGAFIGAMKSAGAISKIPAGLYAPFAITVSALSIASIVQYIRTCIKTRQLIREIELAEAAGKDTQSSYKNVLKLLERRASQDKDFISDFFNADEGEFADALIAIERDAIKEEHKADKAIQGLKGRLKSKFSNTAVYAVASIITIIGTVVLLASPLSAAGWLLLAGAVAIDVARLAHHKIVEYRFAKSIEMKRTPFEWLVC